MVHVIPTYNTKAPNVKRARASWNYPDWLQPLPVHISEMPRTSLTEIEGAKRELPYIRDLVEAGFKKSDTIWLSNLDTGIAVGGINALKDVKLGVCYRRDFLKPIRVPITLSYLDKAGGKSSGIDLVILNKQWWESINYPDLLLGCEGWDWVFRFEVLKSSLDPSDLRDLTIADLTIEERKLPDVIYHEYHGTPFWKVNRDDACNTYNRKLCRQWYDSLPFGVFKDYVLKTWPELKKIPKTVEPKPVVPKTVVPKTVESTVESMVNEGGPVQLDEQDPNKVD